MAAAATASCPVVGWLVPNIDCAMLEIALFAAPKPGPKALPAIPGTPGTKPSAFEAMFCAGVSPDPKAPLTAAVNPPLLVAKPYGTGLTAGSSLAAGVDAAVAEAGSPGSPPGAGEVAAVA